MALTLSGKARRPSPAWRAREYMGGCCLVWVMVVERDLDMKYLL
ncbi:MAG: hypothetical protein O2954_10935 [bacterium]|nr:hypothetical protein [bacterium]